MGLASTLAALGSLIMLAEPFLLSFLSPRSGRILGGILSGPSPFGMYTYPLSLIIFKVFRLARMRARASVVSSL